MTVTINASPTNGLVQTADGSGVIKLQSNGVTTNSLAWVNFNGTTSPGTIRSAYNVSSVTKNGTGDYTLNFTNALSDANYSAVGVSNSLGSTAAAALRIGVFATSSLRIYTTTFSTTQADFDAISIAIFGN